MASSCPATLSLITTVRRSSVAQRGSPPIDGFDCLVLYAAFDLPQIPTLSDTSKWGRRSL